MQPIILHIDLGNQSLSNWLKDNRYVIYSELVRFSEKLITEKLELVQAILVSNLADNIVFIIKQDNVKLTLDKAMEYFLSIEEYEQCAKIRNLYILIENLKDNEAGNIKINRRNKKQSKTD
jgi:transcription initiation factor IIE alpha subunit